MFSEETLEPGFSKEDAEKYLTETFKPHTFSEAEKEAPIPLFMPKGPGMDTHHTR